MTADDLDNLNAIADKALNQNATVDELKEFNQLLTQLEESSNIDLFDNSFSLQREAKKY